MGSDNKKKAAIVVGLVIAACCALAFSLKTASQDPAQPTVVVEPGKTPVSTPPEELGGLPPLKGGH